MKMGDRDRAKAAYQAALAKEPDYSALFGCAMIEMQQKKFELTVVHLGDIRNRGC
jgi:hypothetical protein